jgi:hypothetical protein
VDLLEGGALLTRVNTRSAVSRSVNRVATVARSVSRRAIRSLSLVFSALIWSNIVGVVVGMVTFSGFRLIGMIDLGGVYHRNAGSSTVEYATDLADGGCDLRLSAISRNPRWARFADMPARKPVGLLAIAGWSRQTCRLVPL